MARYISLILVLLISSANLDAKILVSTNGQTLKLGRHTRCHKLETISKQDICDCCLIQQVMVRKKSRMTAIKKCVAHKQCANELGYRLSIEQAQKNLAPLEIVNLNKLDAQLKIPDNGLVNPELVIHILITLENHHVIDLPEELFKLHKDYPCLKAKALGDQVKGLYSGQLFAVSYNRRCLKNTEQDLWQPLYILKETKKGLKEIANLHQLSRSALSQEKIPTMQLVLKPEDFSGQAIARISFEDCHFSIKTLGRNRYFSLLQTASGKSLHQHLKTFAEKIDAMEPKTVANSSELAEIKHSFLRVGYAMAKIHQKYARTDLSGQKIIANTYTHGDFHAQNVFYDPGSDDVTLIDNETFALSLKNPSSGVNDLVDLYLLHSVKTVAHRFAHTLETNLEMGINDQIWHLLWQELFIGYLKALEPKNRAQLIKAYYELREQFYQGISNASVFTSLRNFKDQRMLKRIGPSLRRSLLKHQDLDHTFEQVLLRLTD